MSISYTITLLGISILIFYSLIQIFTFFGISQDTYGVYLLFYVFLILSVIILPNEYPKI
jgi:hypothetical protein